MNNGWDGRSLGGRADGDEAGCIRSQCIVAGVFEFVPGKSCISTDDPGHLKLPVVCLIVVQIGTHDLVPVRLQVGRQVVLKKSLWTVGDGGGCTVIVKGQVEVALSRSRGVEERDGDGGVDSVGIEPHDGIAIFVPVQDVVLVSEEEVGCADHAVSCTIVTISVVLVGRDGLDFWLTLHMYANN